MRTSYTVETVPVRPPVEVAVRPRTPEDLPELVAILAEQQPTSRYPFPSHSSALAVYRHRGWREIGQTHPEWLAEGEEPLLLMVFED